MQSNNGLPTLVILLLVWGALLPFAHSQEPASGGRFDAAVSRFETADAESPPPQGAILAIGSSSMRMWNDRIQDDLAPLTIIPRGFGGSHYSDVLHYINRIVLNYQPRAILIYEGDNDVAGGKTPERILNDLIQLVDLCRETLPQVRFYVLAVKPSLSRSHLWPTMVETNALVKELCATRPGMTYIDVAGPMLGDDGSPLPQLFGEDGLHMLDAGYDVWKTAVHPILMEGELSFEREASPLERVSTPGNPKPLKVVPSMRKHHRR